MAQEDAIPRSIRLVYIQTLLYRRGRGLSSRELAQACGVDVRTVQRDMAALGAPPHNVPVVWTQRRWSLLPEYEPQLSALHLTIPEATALFMAARLLQRASDENNPYVGAALGKMAAVLPEPVGNHVRSLLLSGHSRPVDDIYTRVFAEVAAGWATQRKVRLWYQAASSKNVHEYLVWPLFIEPSAAGLAAYMIGHEETYFKDVRTWKLERISRAELTDQAFEIPESFDVSRFLSSAWGIMGGEETVEVALRFTPEATRRVKESLWHHLQTVEDLPDGGCILRVPVSQPIEMIPWIRGWAHNVEVLAPADLRARVAEEAGKVVAVYTRHVKKESAGG